MSAAQVSRRASILSDVGEKREPERRLTAKQRKALRRRRQILEVVLKALRA